MQFGRFLEGRNIDFLPDATSDPFGVYSKTNGCSLFNKLEIPESAIPWQGTTMVEFCFVSTQFLHPEHPDLFSPLASNTILPHSEPW